MIEESLPELKAKLEKMMLSSEPTTLTTTCSTDDTSSKRNRIEVADLKEAWVDELLC